MTEKKPSLQTYKEEINREIANKETLNTLMEITFKGLTPQLAKRAMLEAMMLGFDFRSFLQKDIYAIPFKNRRENTLEYSLVCSIDYCRKIGMRSGVVGVSAPKYVDDENGKIISCEITVKRKVEENIGEYTALVYFSEYSTGYQQWASKPRTMIAKVAEMHALRKACPEELQKAYIEEEYDREVKEIIDVENVEKENVQESIDKMNACKTIEELSKVWAAIPGDTKSKQEVIDCKEKLKKDLNKTDKKAEKKPEKSEDKK